MDTVSCCPVISRLTPTVTRNAPIGRRLFCCRFHLHLVTLTSPSHHHAPPTNQPATPDPTSTQQSPIPESSPTRPPVRLVIPPAPPYLPSPPTPPTHQAPLRRVKPSRRVQSQHQTQLYLPSLPLPTTIKVKAKNLQNPVLPPPIFAHHLLSSH